MSKQARCPKCFHELWETLEGTVYCPSCEHAGCSDLRRQLAAAQAIVARLPRWSQLASLGQYGLLDAELYEAAEKARKGVCHNGH